MFGKWRRKVRIAIVVFVIIKKLIVMAFSNYKSIAAVLKKFQIKYVQTNFMLEIDFPVKDSFREELDLLFTDGVVDNSEDAICENLIYPILKEVWKPYRDKLTLWSHQSLTYDEDLSGVPNKALPEAPHRHNTAHQTKTDIDIMEVR